MRSSLLALSLAAGLTASPSAAHEGCRLDPGGNGCSQAASATHLRIAQAPPPVVRPPAPTVRPPTLPAPPRIPSGPVQTAPKTRAPVVQPMPMTGQGTTVSPETGTSQSAGPAGQQPKAQKEARPAGKREYIGAIRARYQQILLGRDFNSEIVIWTRLIEASPNNADHYVSRGSVHRFKGDYKAAFADYNKAIALNPRLANAFNNRGLAFLWSGDFDKAIADFDRTLALEPGHAMVRRNREDAVVAKQSPASLEGGVSPTLKQLVELVRQGNELGVKLEWAGAIDRYSRALALDEHNQPVRRLRARAYVSNREFDRGVAESSCL